jgi:hypothetical protein
LRLDAASILIQKAEIGKGEWRFFATQPEKRWVSSVDSSALCDRKAWGVGCWWMSPCCGQDVGVNMAIH